MTQKMTRRQLFSAFAKSGTTIIGAGFVLTACKENGNTKSKPKSYKPQCDVAKLSSGDNKTRSALKYVDQTPNNAQRCNNCKLFIPSKPCHGCSMVKGPIKEDGYCIAWVRKPA